MVALLLWLAREEGEKQCDQGKRKMLWPITLWKLPTALHRGKPFIWVKEVGIKVKLVFQSLHIIWEQCHERWEIKHLCHKFTFNKYKYWNCLFFIWILFLQRKALCCEHMHHLSDRGLLKGKHRMMMLLAVIQKSKGTLRQQSQSVLLTYLFLQQLIHPWRPYALDSSHWMKNKVLNGALQYRAE